MDAKLLRILGNRERNYPHALESRFPRVLGHILSLWESPDIEDYFRALMVTTRPDRQGFPADVATDIMYLSMLHERSKRDDMSDDSWDRVAENCKSTVQSSEVPLSAAGFFASVEAGNFDAVRLFLSCGADVHMFDERQWTPLTVASFYGRHRVAKLLLNGGANVHVIDKAGYTALHWAAFNGFSKVVKLLLDHDADVNARSSHGWSPLIQASSRGHLSVASILIERGADIQSASREGWTSLHKAVANRHEAMVKLLFSKGANVNAVTREGVSVMDLAKRQSYQAIFPLLSGEGWQRLHFDFSESR